MSKSAESVAAPAGFGGPQAGYSLSSDLAKLSLPSEYRDQYRTLAWVNSICFLFLVVGLVGLKAPKVIVKAISEPLEPTQLVEAAPPEPPKIDPLEVKPDEPVLENAPLEAPPVFQPIVAVDRIDVVFAVPVTNATHITSEFRESAPPPPKPTPPQPLRPTAFDPNATGGGFYPQPSYPAFAQRNRQQGVVIVEFTVDASGAVTSVKVQKSSGFNLLDEAVMKIVKERWRFPPGGPRYYFNKFTFELK